MKKVLVAAAAQKISADGHGIPAVVEALAQAFGRYAEGVEDRLQVTAFARPTLFDFGG